MTREHILIVLGALVLLSPWSGIPMNYLQWLYLLIGLTVMGIAYLIRKGRSVSEPAQPPVPTDREPQPRSSHIAFS